MKRVLSSAVMMMMAFTLLLSACGKSNNSPSDANASKGTNAPTANTEKQAEEKVTLQMGSWRTEDKAVYEKLIAEFNKKYPNIKIEFAPTKNTEYNTVLNTALQTGGGPDIIHLRPYAAGIGLGTAGYIEPITGLAGLDTFSKDVLAAATGPDGTVYGVPMALNIVAVMYNKDIFEKYSLKEPATWAEMLQTAETLKSNKVTPFAFGSKDGWIMSLTQGAIGPSGYGGSAFAAQLESGEKKFTDPAYVKSIQLMKDLTPYFPDKFTGIGADDMRTLFVTGQAAMYVMGDFDAAVVRSQNPDLKFDVFAVPPQEAGGQPTVTSYVDGSYAVNANSKHKEEAKKFLEFATTKEFGQLFSTEMNRVSPVPGVEVAEPLVAKYAELANTISTPYIILKSFNQGNPTSKATLENAMQGLYLDKNTVDQVAAELQTNVDTWFKP
ncbi:extracellular solute-binding protein [Paenibacillus sp. NPDC058071]|uniref:ABC transporter substrate-binding protein n=1 Tax=Paenibacillus sp. NPDC058071 TaxID=3346326 RepID=UPI0036DE75B3